LISIMGVSVRRSRRQTERKLERKLTRRIPMPARTPQQIFQHHAEALGAEDLDSIVTDYDGEASFMTPAGVLRGKAGIRQAFNWAEPAAGPAMSALRVDEL
jgi:hypothetical protein